MNIYNRQFERKPNPIKHYFYQSMFLLEFTYACLEWNSRANNFASLVSAQRSINRTYHSLGLLSQGLVSRDTDNAVMVTENIYQLLHLSMTAHKLAPTAYLHYKYGSY